MSGLTGLQSAFVDEYLKDFNGTRAADRAGYAGDDDVLAVIAHKNLNNPRVRERIEAMLKPRIMGVNEALMRLSEIARGEYAEYITDRGTVDIAQMVEDGKAHLVSEIRETRNGTNYKFHDMHSALRDIAKAHGVFVERHEHTGKDGGAIAVRWPEEAED
jgi:phage terminase small subunit